MPRIQIQYYLWREIQQNIFCPLPGIYFILEPILEENIIKPILDDIIIKPVLDDIIPKPISDNISGCWCGYDSLTHHPWNPAEPSFQQYSI